MKIAFLTSHDPLDSRSWSGILLYMYKALERQCGDVVSLGPARQKLQLAGKATAKALRVLSGLNFDSTHTVALSKALARTFRQRLAAAEFDVIFAPVAATELAYLDTELPVVYYGDLTARLFLDYAANVTGLSNWSVKQMEHIELRALARADHLVYASQWAADSAVRHYAVPREKVSVIPMGANLDEIPGIDQITAARQPGASKECRLLFVGVDWERKGGDVALTAMRELRRRGIDAHLTVVGCSPPGSISDPHLQILPFLSKSVPEQRKQLNDLFLHSDFMLFPTHREAFGVVCCEANAFGLPLLASNTGGVPVRNGENGLLLENGASGSEYADAVQRLGNDPALYFSLALSGRRAYDERLNWHAWGTSIARVLREAASTKRRLATATASRPTPQNPATR